MRRELVCALIGLAGCGTQEALEVVAEDPMGSPLADLPADLQARFDRGDARFELPFRAAQGLGPLYIRQSCASCHASDGKGPGSVTKMVLVEADGFTPRADQSALPYGHTARPQRGEGAMQAILPPDGLEGLLITRRIGPAVFGRGWIEAVADAEIERVEAAQRASPGPVKGRINRVTRASETNPDTRYHSFARGQSGLIGRFGLKARVASVDDFTADAFQGDMGMTSALRPEELPNPDHLTDDAKAGPDLDAEQVNEVADYVRMLAIPRRAEAGEGAALFESAGCAECHVPALATRADYPIAAIAGKPAAIYSDLLLHDMGPALADGLVEHGAGPRDWRTAPLIGLRHMRSYLHDGRAATVEEAILLHGGEGAPSTDHFRALSAAEQRALIDFVSTL